MATESNPADMLTKALGRSKVEEIFAEMGQTEPHAKTVDKKPKEVKKLKRVKFAVEAMVNEPDAAKIKNEPKDAKFAKDAYYELNPAKWSRVVNGQVVEPERIIEPSDVVVLELRSASEGSESRANGVATSTSLVARRVSCCSSHTEVCNALGATDGITSLTTIKCTLTMTACTL